VEPWAAHVHGCTPSDVGVTRPAAEGYGFGALNPDVICQCITGILRSPEGGAGLADADIEVFVRLRRILPAGTRAFVIGNAFGYSTVVLALLFARGGVGFVDVLDAEAEGDCNSLGTYLTRKIVAEESFAVNLTLGFSPWDVPKAVTRRTKYALAFIDGRHTNDQLLMDFVAIERHLARAAVVVLHDVGTYEMHASVARISSRWHRHVPRGWAYKNLLGTVLLHRGFAPGTFADL
jgi:predicted O-methyltransferase YrrM